MANTTGYNRDRTGIYIEKDPEATLDYTLNWADWLSSSSTTITGSTWSVSADADDTDPVTIAGSGNNTTITTVTLTGGTVNEIYTIYNTITTAGGITERRNFRVVVKNRSV